MDTLVDTTASTALTTTVPPQWARALPDPGTSAAGAGSDGASAAVGDLTVMMIDDEPMLTEVIAAHLEDAGFRHVVGVNDATVALQQVREMSPALVLLDLVMPRVSGFEILQGIRQDEQLRYTPVIVLTAASDPGSVAPSIRDNSSRSGVRPRRSTVSSSRKLA